MLSTDNNQLVITITAEMQKEIRYNDAAIQDAMPVQTDEVTEDMCQAQMDGYRAESRRCIFEDVLRAAFYRERIDFSEEVIGKVRYPGVNGSYPYDAEVIAVTIQFNGNAYRIHQREFGGFIHNKEIRISG